MKNRQENVDVGREDNCLMKKESVCASERCTPLVSVIIPAYNNVNWLIEAVESVLKQDYSNLEIIVINDGSTESFDDFLKKYKHRIRYFSGPNRGVAYSRNLGIEKSVGEYIAFLDSDDLWAENKVSVQVKYMINNGCGWSQHRYVYFSNSDRTILKHIDTSMYKGEIVDYIFTSFRIQTSCIMVKRDVLTNNPKVRFDEKKTFGEDNMFYLGLAEKYPLGFIDEELTYYRVRGKNAGTNISAQLNYRGTLYKDMHLDKVYIDNTTRLTKASYAYCYHIMARWNCVVSKNDWRTKLLYAPAWVCFKVSYKLRNVLRKNR